jgi:ribosomal protein S18 acetylase RimI-like enzyme
MAPHVILVSYLEMTNPPSEERRNRPPVDAEVSRKRLDVPTYLQLYRMVGGPFGWDKRLKMPEGVLRDFLIAPTTDVYTLSLAGQLVGFCEIDRAGTPSFELCNFGVVPCVQGRGLGPYLLDQALRGAWTYQPHRIWLHTDEEDHPAAIRTYERAGFRLYDQRLEDATDL